MPSPLATAGAFDLLEQVGRGGMGVVARGRHRRSDMQVAIKLLTDAAARKADYRALFRSEVRAVAGLSHRHVVRVYDHGELDAPILVGEDALATGTPYLVMEWADTGTLQDRGRAECWEQLFGDLVVLLEALAHVHAHEVVHRDLKPANVLCCGDASRRPGLKLADFGIAHLAGAGPGEAHGTPSFMAPEQVEARLHDQGPWTDLYALGCMVYSLSRGASPFFAPGRTAAEIGAAQIIEPPPALHATFAVPRALEAWTLKLLAKNPYERFRTAADALHRLRELDPVANGGETAAPELIEPVSTSELATVVQPMLVEPGPAKVSEVNEDDRPPVPEDWRRDQPEEPVELTDAGLGLFGLRPIPMVGREAERGALWGALVEVDHTSTPRCVMLEGAAGAGKSRLAAWLVARARELGAGAPLLVTHAPEPGPNDGLGAALRRLVRAGSGPVSEVVARLIEHNRAIGEREPEQWYALAPIVAPELRGRSARVGGAEERAAALERYFRRLGRGRPAILVLDDAQWALDGIELAESLLAATEPLRVLLVLTVREDALAGRPRERAALERVAAHPATRRRAVRALEGAEHASLVRRLLGLAPQLAERVSARTAGNPLFAVQLVGDWVARGLLETGADGFVVREGATLELPDSLHGLWSTRLARALEGRAPSDRVALELAATLGLSVERGEWVDACAAASLEAPVDLVERLVVERLALDDRAAPGLAFAFVHAMLRESLLRGAREANRLTAHHRACARMLAQRGAQGTAGRLARHLVAAQMPAPALEAFRDAIAESIASGRYAAAGELLAEHDRTMAMLSLPPHDTRRLLAESMAARLARAEARYQDAIDRCTAALATAGEPTTPPARAAVAELLLELARSTVFVSGTAETREPISRALAIARPLGRDALTAATLQLASQVSLVSGDVEGALAQAREALSYFGDEESFDTNRTLLSLANCEKIAGQTEQARAHAEQARDMARKIGWRRGSGIALTLLGEVARTEGRLDEAERSYRRAAEMHAAVRDGNELFSILNLGQVLTERGVHAEARVLFERSLGALEERGMKPLATSARVFLLPVVAALGDWDAYDTHATAIDAAEGAGLMDPDIAQAARRAAETAEAEGHVGRALTARRLERAQYVGLGDDAAADALEETIAGLAAIVGEG